MHTCSSKTSIGKRNDAAPTVHGNNSSTMFSIHNRFPSGNVLTESQPAIRIFSEVSTAKRRTVSISKRRVAFFCDTN